MVAIELISQIFILLATILKFKYLCFLKLSMASKKEMLSFCFLLYFKNYIIFEDLRLLDMQNLFTIVLSYVAYFHLSCMLFLWKSS